MRIWACFVVNNEVTMNTKVTQLLNHLTDGAEFTDAEIKLDFGIASAKSAMKALQSEGYAVYMNRIGGTKFLRLGTPTRRVVAAGYKALAA